ncbi:MAG: hypothetical protein KF729_38055 [Sandaracinaceae bacterium]|nr:hypothetical protein [Sandaracinaceae bacterium]
MPTADDDLELDDALAELDARKKSKGAEGGGKKPGAAEKKPEAKASPAGTPHIALRIVLGVAGLLLLVGFFLDWLKIEGPQGTETVSGLGLVMADHPVIRGLIGQGGQRYALLAIPAFGAALSAVGFLGVRYSGQIAAALGVLIVGYGVVTVLVFFFQKTGVGLWLVLGGAFVAIAAGFLTYARSRGGAAKKPAD